MNSIFQSAVFAENDATTKRIENVGVLVETYGERFASMPVEHGAGRFLIWKELMQLLQCKAGLIELALLCIQ